MARGGSRKGAGRPKGKVGPTRKTRAIREALQRDAELNAANTVEQIRRGAFRDVRELFDEEGNLRPIHTLSEKAAAQIVGFEVVKRNITSGDGQTDTILKLKLEGRIGYVEMAAKHHGLLEEKVVHSGGLDIRWKGEE